MAERLAGKVALITGAGGGQGRAAALMFAKEGARVVAADIKVEGGNETVQMVRAAGGRDIDEIIRHNRGYVRRDTPLGKRRLALVDRAAVRVARYWMGRRYE